MMTLLSSDCYHLHEGLSDEVPSSEVHRPAPNEAAQEELFLQKLGARGWGRIHQFRNYYGPGWGEGQGRSLSPRAMAAFCQFLETATFPSGCLPSVFLTDRGGLELCWENADGKAVQVEFTSEGAEYYLEEGEIESMVSHAKMKALAEQLSAA